MITSRLVTMRKSCESGVKEIENFSVVPGLVVAPSFDSRVIQETGVSPNEEFRDMEYIPQIESLEKFETRDSLMNAQGLTEPAEEVDGTESGIAKIELGKFHYCSF